MPETSLAISLRTGLDQLPGERLDAEQAGRLLAYVELLHRWSQTYNLTSVRNPREMISRHVLDSLAVLPWISGSRLLDAGTGAGLPGIPLGIARPALEVTVLDSAGKKVRFLNHVVRELGLENVRPVQARLESFEPVDAYDAIISRAFASLAEFAEAARHLAATARLLAMKGRYPAEELDELPDWVELQSIEKLVVPGLQEDRHLVIMSVNP